MNARLHKSFIINFQQESADFRDVVCVSLPKILHIFISMMWLTSFLLGQPFCLSRSVKFPNIHWLCMMCSIFVGVVHILLAIYLVTAYIVELGRCLVFQRILWIFFFPQNSNLMRLGSLSVFLFEETLQLDCSSVRY